MRQGQRKWLNSQSLDSPIFLKSVQEFSATTQVYEIVSELLEQLGIDNPLQLDIVEDVFLAGQIILHLNIVKATKSRSIFDVYLDLYSQYQASINQG